MQKKILEHQSKSPPPLFGSEKVGKPDVSNHGARLTSWVTGTVAHESLPKVVCQSPIRFQDT